MNTLALSYKIQKRNGTLVDFNLDKIKNAIEKAALDEGLMDAELPKYLADKVARLIDEHYIQPEKPLGVEQIQDLVEIVLMKSGHLKIAKGFILYRAEHKKIREEKQKEVQEKVKHKTFTVLDENGKEEIFNPAKWERRINELSKDLPNVSSEAILHEAVKLLYDGMRASELPVAILNATRTLIEKHYDYSYLAARLLWDQLKLDVLQTEKPTEEHAKKAFFEYIEKGVEYELLNPELKKFDLEKLNNAIAPERNNLFQYLGARTIADRYLLKTPTFPQKIFELPQWMWMRVAMGLALEEKDRDEKAIEFYHVLSQFHFVSSTPTLFNSGTTHSQMSSCYLNTVEDSLSGIFKSYGDVAQLSKFAGGIGTDWTNIRSTGAMIKGTNGASQGVIPFLKIFNDVCLAVNQGGKRKGAMAAYLEVWHGDIEEFLELKKNTGDERRRTHDIHPALWIPDLFMKRVAENKEWTLFSPSDVPELHHLYGKAFEEKYIEYEQKGVGSARKVKAVDIWRKALTMLFETGHPWITFKDPCNIRSPQDHAGVVHNSNLCTEITLNTSADETAVCNLGSLNLAKMITNGKLDDKKIKETVSTAMRMLDNVIDINFYPTKEAENSNRKHRPVGLGLMGYHDALYQLGIDFASNQQIEFADECMETISYYSILASSKLAGERGAYSSYKGSKWERGLLPIDTLQMLEDERGIELTIPKTGTRDWTAVRESIKKNGMRNSNCMAIAPTATISNIAGSIPCVEPIFKNIYMKENLSGNFVVLNKYMVDDLIAEGLWDDDMIAHIKHGDGSLAKIDGIPAHLKKKYLEVFEIEPKYVIEAAARRQKWIDQSCSTNVFLKTTSGKVLSDTYTDVWKMGMKTTYYLRTLAASQITKTVELPTSAKKASPHKSAATPEPKAVATDVSGKKMCSILDPDCEACQ
jgi:ribonucleoside-diphosphate reductase alpha chain